MWKERKQRFEVVQTWINSDPKLFSGLLIKGNELFCTVCQRIVDSSTKIHVLKHLDRHAVSNKEDANFTNDLDEAFAASEISMEKLNNPIFRGFLEKYMDRKMPYPPTLGIDKKPYMEKNSSSDEKLKPTTSHECENKWIANKCKEGDEMKEDIYTVSSEGSDDEPQAKVKRATEAVDNKANTMVTSLERISKKFSTREDEGTSSNNKLLPNIKTKFSELPTDNEIRIFIKNILENANLGEITMKMVCQRVYSRFPNLDLTYRKDFIKSTVDNHLYQQELLRSLY